MVEAKIFYELCGSDKTFLIIINTERANEENFTIFYCLKPFFFFFFLPKSRKRRFNR